MAIIVESLDGKFSGLSFSKKTVIHKEKMNCGISCVIRISEYYNKSSSKELCEQINNYRSLISIKEIVEILSSLDFDSRLLCIPIYLIGQLNVPGILFWNENHFVVIHRIHAGLFYIYDPNIGQVAYSLREFSGFWVLKNEKSFSKGIFIEIYEKKIGIDK